jgi:Gpi18-like mannosyltransferase
MIEINKVLPKQLDRLTDLLVLVLGLVFAAHLRYVFRKFESADFMFFTSRWYAAVQDQGLGATASDVSNYTPPYLYLLNVVSVLLPNLAPVMAVKIPSLVFDFVCAGVVYAITRLRYRSGRLPTFAFLAALLAPSVVTNSAIWGQADSIYTGMLLVCVYCLMTRRPVVAMLAFGVALSLKFQAMLLAPAIFALWLRRHVPLWAPLLVPLVYILLMVPAWREGRPFSELMSVYFVQSQTFQHLTINAPTLYAWIPNGSDSPFYSAVVLAGLLLMTVIGGLFAWLVWRSRARLDEAIILRLCMLSLIMTPFFLPKMHDRFFFPADVLAVAYGFFFPRQYYIPIAVGFASFIAYNYSLLELRLVPLRGLALVMLFALVAVMWATVRDLKADTDQVSNSTSWAT